MVVGITGNYCSGKDIACSIFQEQGYEIIDVDRIGHEALEAKKDEVVQAFGRGIVGGDAIDRKKLGMIVFSSQEKKRKLENIVHPYMIKRVRELVRQADKAVINAALLIEMCLFVLCDIVVAILAPEVILVDRAVHRDGISRTEALQRLGAQIPIKEKLQYVDKIIDNNGSRDEFEQKIKSLIADLG